MSRVVVNVMPKPEILDPQGKAVTGALQRLGFQGLSVRQGKRFEIEVVALSTMRGPASVARLLYRESDASRLAREQASALRAAERAGFSPPESKPDKRARRLIRALGDIDAS